MFDANNMFGYDRLFINAEFDIGYMSFDAGLNPVLIFHMLWELQKVQEI